MNLPVPMQVFIVFYAISWGALANARPRWRAFDTSRFFADGLARKRIFLSVLVLNILPPCYFAGWLAVVGNNPKWEFSRWGLRAFVAVLVAAIAAWAAPFAFHRVWVGVVLLRPRFFYPTNLGDECWKEKFPGLQKDDFCPKWVCANFIFAAVYFAVSLLPPLAFLHYW